MAIHTISNSCLVVTVSEKGAELQSIKSADGREYLWQGEPEFWNRRSPVLFPFVGAVVDDKYTYQGKEYISKQHGFARDKQFELDSKADTALSYTLTSDEETKANYPFDFALTIGYALHNNELTVSWTVKNTGDSMQAWSRNSRAARSPAPIRAHCRPCRRVPRHWASSAPRGASCGLDRTIRIHAGCWGRRACRRPLSM